MQGYYTIPTVMMSLGTFQFGIASAAYQELARSTEYRWPSQDRFGQRPVSQFTGIGNDTITLPGVIYPEYRGGLGQLDTMRALAGQGKPQQLIDGRGNVLGMWAIERVEEKQGVFAAFGAARKQEFTLTIKRVDDSDVTGNLASAISSAVGVVAAVASGQQIITAATAAGMLASIINTAIVRAATISAALTGSVANCTALAGDIGAGAPALLNGLAVSIDTAASLRDAGGAALTSLKVASTVPMVATVATAMLGDVNRLARIAAAQSAAVGSVTAATPAGAAAVKGALVNANMMTGQACSTTNALADLRKKIG